MSANTKGSALRDFSNMLSVASSSTSSLSRLSDGELVKAHNEGEPLACAEIYRRYWLRLVIFADKIVQDRDLAEDIVQNTFLKLLKHLPMFRDESKLRSWLFTAVKNFIVSDIRSFRSRNETSLSLVPDEEEVYEDKENSTERVLDRKQAEETLREAMVKMTPSLRESYYLFHMDDLSHNEIAELLGITVGTVKMRVHRAKLQLAVILAAERL
ncbi:sigma-70 family RNA polymerase sigma factor [Candidatus Parcubacteria bacterium]|nr:sigma-70 family RNA polymerase sigma factor [Candidatus Parcubacteria bacterium]